METIYTPNLITNISAKLHTMETMKWNKQQIKFW